MSTPTPDSPPRPKNPVPRGLRIGAFLLSVLLTFLLIWLLGFILGDIGSLDGPDYQEIRKRHVDQALQETSESLQKQISEISAKFVSIAKSNHGTFG